MASQTQKDANTNRGFIYGTGDDLRSRARRDADAAAGRRDFYGAAADEQYIPLLEGRAGYTDAEKVDILGRDRLEGLKLSPEQERARFLTGDEVNAIRGNAWDRAKFYSPGEDLAAVNDRGNLVRGAVDQYGREMQDAIRPDDLRVSGDYASDIDRAVYGGGARVRSTIDPTNLHLSDEFVQNYRMTPEQQQRFLTSAARDSTAISSAEIGRNVEAARAAGMDPLGVASYTDRANRRARQDAARAVSSAEVATDRERAQRERDIEQMRLGAESGYSGLASGTELSLQGRELDATQRKEDTRLGAERDLSNRQLSAADSVGRTRVGAESDAAGREQQQRQFNTQQGYGVMRDIADQGTNTERYLAENRQAAERGTQDAAYDRNAYADAQISGRTAGVADTRRTDEREGRGYLIDRQNFQSDREQQEKNRQAGLYGTQGQLMLGNTAVQAGQDNQPKWWEKALSGAGAALSYI